MTPGMSMAPCAATSADCPTCLVHESVSQGGGHACTAPNTQTPVFVIPDPPSPKPLSLLCVFFPFSSLFPFLCRPQPQCPGPHVQGSPAEPSENRGQAAKRVQAALQGLETAPHVPSARLPLGPREAACGSSLVMAGGHDASWFCPKYGLLCGAHGDVICTEGGDEIAL